MPVEAKTTTSEPTWRVLVAPTNGGKIFGKRRDVGETFAAPETAMHMQELEGLVERVQGAPPVAPAPKGKPPVDPGT